MGGCSSGTSGTAAVGLTGFLRGGPALRGTTGTGMDAGVFEPCDSVDSEDNTDAFSEFLRLGKYSITGWFNPAVIIPVID